MNLFFQRWSKIFPKQDIAQKRLDDCCKIRSSNDSYGNHAWQAVYRSCLEQSRWQSIFSENFRFWASGFLLSLLVLTIANWPLYAAIEIEYFNVSTVDEHLRLEWQTVVENDLAAIEVYCKEEDESLSAYHLVGTRLAQGSKEAGAQYQMDLYDGIDPAATYCFRLKEITTDGRKGDLLDYCGYGLDIIPVDESADNIENDLQTIDSTSIITETETVTSTLIATATSDISADTASTGTITTTIVPTSDSSQTITIIPTPNQTTVPPAEEIITPTLDTLTPVGDNATENEGNSDIIVVVTQTKRPTPQPSTIATPIPSDDATETALPTVTVEEEVVATDEPIIIQSSSADQGSPLATPTQTPTVDEQTETDNSTDVDMGSGIGNAPGQPESTGAALLDVEQNTVSEPPYIILTATPNVSSALLQPTFTPFPTAVIQSNTNLITATLPSQNLMILLLCGVFSGASGLGILGIVTTLLYMRSRSS